MLQDLGREPTPEGLAVELDMTTGKVIEVQKYRLSATSFPDSPDPQRRRSAPGASHHDHWPADLV
jgi:DNA-directed RNA polymerase sigma subunit (sigma70/sigma32)